MMVLVSFLEILATMERNTLTTISSKKIVHVQVMVVMTQKYNPNAIPDPGSCNYITLYTIVGDPNAITLLTYSYPNTLGSTYEWVKRLVILKLMK